MSRMSSLQDCLSNCQNLSQCNQIAKSAQSHKAMSPHHSDQMSQWLQVSRIALCMAKVNVTQSMTK